mgnify:CR=1 FL=1
MSEVISRFGDISGRSIINDLFHAVERGEVRIQITEVSDGRRLDHYAQKYYGNGLNWWIIAAASGIRWPLAIGSGFPGGNKEYSEGVVLYIPVLEDVIALKGRI